MRTLVQIIEAAKDGQSVSHSEAYYAMLALDVLLSVENIALSNIIQQSNAGKVNTALWRKVGEASRERLRGAFVNDPQTLLGKDNDPAQPEYQARRAKLREKIEAAREAQRGN